MSTTSQAMNLDAQAAPRQTARSSTLEYLFREHFRLIYETALHVTGNSHDADEVVQNIFLQLIRSKRPLDALGNPAGYLRRAATNQSLKIVYERKRVDLTSDADLIEIPAPAQTASSPTPGRRLLRFMQTLRPAAALMIKLRYVEGLTNKEIAKTLGKSEPVVAVTLFRLRRRLMKIGKEEL